VKAILKEALERLERDCKDSNRDQPRSSYIWEIFRVRILDPIFEGIKPAPYGDLVRRFDLRSPTEGTNMLLSAKLKFKRHLKDVMSEEPVGGPVESELREFTEFIDNLANQKPGKK
jgi:hypothetical protein